MYLFANSLQDSGTPRYPKFSYAARRIMRRVNEALLGFGHFAERAYEAEKQAGYLPEFAPGQFVFQGGWRG
jgi:hypothetical protein